MYVCVFVVHVCGTYPVSVFVNVSVWVSSKTNVQYILSKAFKKCKTFVCTVIDVLDTAWHKINARVYHKPLCSDRIKILHECGHTKHMYIF